MTAAAAPFDAEHWMGQTIPAAMRVVDITLPGTHDSGAYALDASVPVVDEAIEGMRSYYPWLPWVRSISRRWTLTQDRSLRDQLRMGIRALDLRVSYLRGALYISHGFATIPLETALREVSEFAASHPRELLVVEVVADVQNEATMSDEARARFWAMWDEAMPRAPSAPFTYGALVQAGTNVIVEAREMGRTTIGLSSLWPNTTKVDEMLRQNIDWLDGMPGEPVEFNRMLLTVTGNVNTIISDAKCMVSENLHWGALLILAAIVAGVLFARRIRGGSTGDGDCVCAVDDDAADNAADAPSRISIASMVWRAIAASRVRTIAVAVSIVSLIALGVWASNAGCEDRFAGVRSTVGEVHTMGGALLAHENAPRLSIVGMDFPTAQLVRKVVALNCDKVAAAGGGPGGGICAAAAEK